MSYIRTAPAVIHGKDHSCNKPTCAFCNRLQTGACKSLVKILNMPGVTWERDRVREIFKPLLEK